MAAIPTVYNGVQFRSRGEAKWAAFFDGIGWTWEYEPFDGEGYIADFLIPGAMPMLVEIKPMALTWEDYIAPVPKMETGFPDWPHDFLVLGDSPLPQIECGNWQLRDNYVAGAMSERWTGTIEVDTLHVPVAQQRDLDHAIWMTCGKCGRVAVHHCFQSYAGRPCGHKDGDHYMGGISRGLIENYWTQAINATQWRGAATLK